ncbi:MAG: hypothetical protein R3F46_14470 [bacterium]
MGAGRLKLVAALLAGILVLALVWLMLSPRGGGSGGRGPGGSPRMQQGSNPNLDVRFSYDARYFTVGPFIDNAEFPFLLEGEGWGMQGKRIRGMATLLHAEPVSALYDWLGVMQMEGLEKYYQLKPDGEPLYEDWQVDGGLAVHQQLSYVITADDPRLPGYFPEELRTAAGKGDRVYIEGWVFFNDNDLFFFQAVSGMPLDEGQREACDDVLQSLKFNAMLGAGRSEPQPDPGDGNTEAPAGE